MSSRRLIEEMEDSMLRSRSSRSRFFDHSRVSMMDSLKQSCWANMPADLLRDVLKRIEESASSWPRRKDVVACAGVCRSWREIVKEIVKMPEVSGRITFLISLKQPGPRDFPLQCFIKWNRTNQTFHLYLGLTQAMTDDGKFLLVARKLQRPTCTDYIITLDIDDVPKGRGAYIGTLRSNLLGTKFVACVSRHPYAGVTFAESRSNRLVSSKQVTPIVPAGNYPVAHISYALNVYPRRKCIMYSIPLSAIEPGRSTATQAEFLIECRGPFSSTSFFRSKSSGAENLSGSLLGGYAGKLVLKSKSTRPHEQLQCLCLNFKGASVKNFQPVASEENEQTNQEHDKVILQFRKVGIDLFKMEFRHPISGFQAFAVFLSSIDPQLFL